ncbi:MAG: diguanylate cyclase [Candidatus Polarisedimenticolaceae bacterium]|nr:diguanylate cyclase [Candidatus Polarisedimenticolaceae bacterium]
MQTKLSHTLKQLDREEARLRRYTWLLLFFWSIVSATSLGWGLLEQHQNTQEIALTQAHAHLNRDVAYRSWVGHQQGIYVETSSKVLPSRYLQDLPDHIFTTPSGKELTRINPEYLARMVNKTFPKLHGSPIHVSSLGYRRLLNAPDAWEKAALYKFMRGIPEVVEFTEFNGAPYLRLMKPLLFDKSCKPCHPNQPYNKGDIMGGMAITVPLSELIAITHKQNTVSTIWHALLWLLGLCGIYLGRDQLIKGLYRQRDAIEIINRQATYDLLTNLPNRRLMIDLIQHAEAQCTHHGHFAALLFIDLDHFKIINDTRGHNVGDLLLIEVAKRLRTRLRGEDRAARLGGDEFLVLLPKVSGEIEVATDHARSVAEKLRITLAEPYLIKGEKITLSSSIGITLFPPQESRGESVTDILNRADKAMYHAKSAGRNRTSF